MSWTLPWSSVSIVCTHPNKRTKTRHLEDHNVGPVALTWDNCQPVFDFFKPKILPEYDSYKASTVSAELECLLRRIVALIPPFENKVTVDLLTSYIYAGCDVAPVTEDVNPNVPCVVKEIYYLLADYYFNKTKEMILGSLKNDPPAALDASSNTIERIGLLYTV